MEEESILKRWAEENGHLIPEESWRTLKPISDHTSEHQVRYRQVDHRAIKRTWPGMFGFVPRKSAGTWMPQPATPGEYLIRQALQNEFFGDSIRLEGAMISEGLPLLNGQPSGGLSLVVSQPWLDAVDQNQPHPSEGDIARHLKDRGFRPLFGSFFGWQEEELGLVVLDAKADNFIATDLGIFPIDLQIARFRTAA